MEFFIYIKKNHKPKHTRPKHPWVNWSSKIDWQTWPEISSRGNQQPWDCKAAGIVIVSKARYSLGSSYCWVSLWQVISFICLGWENTHQVLSTWGTAPVAMFGVHCPLRDISDASERGEWKAGLKLNIQKTKIMASGPITSWKIDGETMKDYFLGFQNPCRWWLQPWN